MKNQEHKQSGSSSHHTSLKSMFGASSTPNLIGKGIEIHGTYLSPKDAFIEGTIEGGVEVDGRLVLLETGIIKGNVIAGEIVLVGSVNGDLYCKGKTTIKNTARVKGNIYTASLVVEEDAIVEGEIYMAEKGQTFQLNAEIATKEPEMAFVS